MLANRGLGSSTAGELARAHIERAEGASAAQGSPASQKFFRDAIMRQQSSFQRCYESQLKSNSALAGKVTLALKIERRGEYSRVVGLKVEENEVGDAIASCMMGVMRRLNLPQPVDDPQGVDLSLRFVFVAGE